MIKQIWPNNFVDRVWFKHFQSFERFYKEHKRWPTNSDVYEGFRIGDWLYRNRVEYFKGKLHQLRLEKFKELGYPFKEIKVNDQLWDFYLEQLKKYIKQYPERWANKNRYLPHHKRLRAWCKEMQTRYNRGSLGPLRKRILDELEFPFQKKVPHSQRFNQQLNYLKQYQKEFPGKKIPRKLIYPEGNRLGNWCSYIRIQKATLSNSQIKALNEAGFDWSPNQSHWEERCNKTLQFFKTHQRPPKAGKESDLTEIQLALWLKAQRKQYKIRALPPEKVEKLIPVLKARRQPTSKNKSSNSLTN